MWKILGEDRIVSTIRNRNTKRRVVLGLTMLILFIVLSGISLLVVRKKILDTVQIMGEEISSHLLLKEDKKIDSYEMFLKTASRWLNNLIEKETDTEEIREWFKAYRDYVGDELNSELVEIYSTIDGKIIGATNWEGAAAVDLSQANWYTKAVEADGKIIYTDLYKDIRTGEDVITLALKINDKNDVLAIDIYTKDLISQNQIEPLDYFLEGTYYYLCDTNGNIIYMKSKVGDCLEEVKKYVDNIVHSIESGKYESSSSFMYDLNNEKRGVYYSRSPQGWLSIVTIPYAVLLSEMMVLYYLYLGSAILFFIIGFILYKREERMNRIVEETNDTIRVLGNSYYGIYRINFKKETYVMIKGSDYVRSRIASKGNYVDLENVLLEIIDEDAKKEFLEAFSIINMKELVKNRVRDFGGDFKRKLGNEYRWSNIRLLFDESLSPGEIILCFKDIDQEKKKSLEYTEILKTSLKTMEENTEAKNLFFSSMSHDMRTPLNGIIGLSELAKNHVNNSESIIKYLEKINNSSKQLLNLINDILELSKLEFNKRDILLEEFSLKERLDSIVDIFKIEGEKTGKNFIVNYEFENSYVRGDFSKLHQILNNLLSNAFKYTKENGTIFFTVQELNRDGHTNYSFTIKDNGCGMTKEFLEKIYLPFERETNFGAKGIKGTGLGMAIVKTLVGQLGGEIKIESEIDKGTEINLLIPLEVIGDIAEEEEIEKVEEVGFKGKKILVAEDNDINMEIITELLTMKELVVVQAWNGKEALEIFKNSKENEFDMILMDMQMPELNGCDATKEIRKLAREDAKDIPIIAVTANAFAEDIAATTMAGMNSHISKPIDFLILEKILKEYLS